METELKAIFGRRPEKVLFIETAPSNRIEDVRRVFTAAKKQGIRLYALLGAPPPNGSLGLHNSHMQLPGA